MKVRGRTGNTSLIRGREAELEAIRYFKSGGHDVIDVAHQNLMHDIEVQGVGRVQVKRAFMIERRAKPRAYKRRPHRDALTTHLRWRVKLSAGNSNARYPADAFDVLCIAFPLRCGWRFIVRSAAKLVVPGTNYMRDCLTVAQSSAMTCWQTSISDGEALYREEATDGTTSPQ